MVILALGCTSSNEEDFNWVNPLPEQSYPLVRHETFFSELMQTEVGYNIYFPPGYDSTNADKRYPVVYYLHGWRRGSEANSVYMATLFNEWMVNGSIPPRIYVFPNGGKLSHYDYDGYFGESTFVKELIPHIDANYPTIADRSGRGLEGFSMGGRAVARDMFKYPDMFCSAVSIGGGQHKERMLPGGEGNEDEVAASRGGNNSWDLAMSYSMREDGIPIKILVVVGTADRNYPGNVDWMVHLDSLGIAYSSHVVEGIRHEAADLYAVLGDSIMAFHEQCFSADS